MKIKHASLLAILIAVVTTSVFGHDWPRDTTQAKKIHQEMVGMMGTPEVDANVEGIHIKVWVMTQAEHKEMMDGKEGQKLIEDMRVMREDGVTMNASNKEMTEDMKEMREERMERFEETREAMMSGTHLIMVEVTDPATGRTIDKAKAEVKYSSPTRERETTDLRPAMSHLGNGITLKEKGKYKFTVKVKTTGGWKSKDFDYTAK